MATNNAVNVQLSGSTGTGAFVGNNSPTLISPALGSATATSLTFGNGNPGIVGINGSNLAQAGSVGQIVSSNISSGSAVSITTDIIQNMTSISLTAGDWDLYGNLVFNGGATTIVKKLSGWISSTSATAPDDSLIASYSYGTTGVAVFAQAPVGFSSPAINLQLAATTTIYISVLATFTTSTCTTYGLIFARRRR